MKKAIYMIVFICGSITIIISSIKYSKNDDLHIDQEITSGNIHKIKLIVNSYEQHKLTTKTSPWELFHGLLARMNDYYISDGNNQQISCVNWLLRDITKAGGYEGVQLIVSRNEGFYFTHGPFLDRKQVYEDHFCQFLFILMESGVSTEEPFNCLGAEGENHTLKELVDSAQKTCHGRTDLSWALPVFAKWATNNEWINKFGLSYDLDRVFLQHIMQKYEPHCSSCFSTHWKNGLGIGLKYGKHKISKKVRNAAEQILYEEIDRAKLNQKSDGLFDLNLQNYIFDFNHPQEIDPEIKIDYQGHTLEWIMAALDDKVLANEEWPHLAVSWLCNAIIEYKGKLSYGSFSHCIHAFKLYEKRMSGIM